MLHIYEGKYVFKRLLRSILTVSRFVGLKCGTPKFFALLFSIIESFLYGLVLPQDLEADIWESRFSLPSEQNYFHMRQAPKIE